MDRVGPDKNGPDTDATEAQNSRRAKFPCIRCGKNVTKNSKSVKCSTCELWVHAECERFSPEFFNILANPDKYGAAGVCWNCSSCQASALRLEKLVKGVEGRIQQVEDCVRGTEAGVTDLDKRVDKMERRVLREDDKRDKDQRKIKQDIMNEMADRDSRRYNVVLHKVGEHDQVDATGPMRIEWDKKSCQNISRELKLSLRMDDIKFCRRLGEKSSEPRPLLVGFYSETHRNELLKNARNLEKTKFRDVNIGPDLTKEQREREIELKREAERRNEQLTEEDRSKNQEWAVVGARGEKRLIKTTARAPHQPNRQNWQAGRARGGDPQRYSRPNRRPAEPTDESEEEEEETFTTQSQLTVPQRDSQARRGSKRKGTTDDDMDTESRPPGKGRQKEKH